MKILFIEDALDGHHIPYLNGLTSCRNFESVVIIPEYSEKINATQIVYSNLRFPTKSVWDYWKWICFIAKETRKNKYDVVHFLDGDTIMRFFGLGFAMLRVPKVLITYHGFYEGMLRAMSYRLMCMNRIAVVHTAFFDEKLRQLGVKKVEVVEYPSFSSTVTSDVSAAEKIPVLGALGGTRWDKGLDILLEALSQVPKPYKLLIAGQPVDILQEHIEIAQKKIAGEIICDLKYLTDEDFNKYLNMVDIFIIPYRRSFNGASGPLIEGIARGKMIIGSDHGSIGQVIRDNHVGKTFESENVNELAMLITQSLEKKFVYDEVAKRYQHQLSVEGFQNSYYIIYSA